MTSILTDSDFDNFYIRLYFDTSDGYLYASIKRAYRDFNRTIRNIPKELKERDIWRKTLYAILASRADRILTTSFSDQVEFTKWHKATCLAICEASNNILTIGQSQKWINMTLKYAFTFGNSRINGISKNYSFFHIPIDNIIQEILKEKYNIQKITGYSWSTIPDYDTYYNYQKEVRNALKGKIVMDEEFILFNTS